MISKNLHSSSSISISISISVVVGISVDGGDICNDSNYFELIHILIEFCRALQVVDLPYDDNDNDDDDDDDSDNGVLKLPYKPFLGI